MPIGLEDFLVFPLLFYIFFFLYTKKSMVILLLANLILPELYNNMNRLGQFENKLNWFRHKHLTKRSEVRILPPLNVVVLKKVI